MANSGNELTSGADGVPGEAARLARQRPDTLCRVLRRWRPTPSRMVSVAVGTLTAKAA